MKGQNTNGQKYQSILDAHAPPLCNFKLTLEFLMVTVLRQTRAIIGTEARESRIRLNQIHQHILFQFNLSNTRGSEGQHHHPVMEFASQLDVFYLLTFIAMLCKS